MRPTMISPPPCTLHRKPYTVCPMPIYKNPENLKNKIIQECMKLKRFNEWESHQREKPDIESCLSAVFELYEMIPDYAKHRPINVKGIMKMRKELACLV